MKIVITNTAMSNGGDAAICFAIMEIVRRTFGPDTQFTLIDPLAHVAKRYYPDFEIIQAACFASQLTLRGRWRRLIRPINRYRFKRLRLAQSLRAAGIELTDWLLTPLERRIARAYRDADLVITTGGTYLVDHYDISPRLFELQLALYAGKPPIFFTQSLGPFRAPGMAERVRPFFERAPLVLLRDERSKGTLEQLGIAPAKLHVLADSVFAVARPEALAAAMAADTRIRRIAVSVRRWTFFEGRDEGSGMEDYISAVAKAVERLLAAAPDCEATFISTCQGIPEYQAKDSECAAEVVARITNPAIRSRVRVDSDFHNPFELQAILSGFDLVIATRMHMAILSLCAGVPVLPIAYEFKTTELFKRLGMEKWIMPIESAAGDALAVMLEDFIQHLPEVRHALFAGVEQERKLALSAGPLVKDSAQSAAIP